MAKLVELPKDIENILNTYGQEDAYMTAAAKYCQSIYNNPMAGKVLRFQVADSYAQYMVAGYEQLIHIKISDARSISAAHVRGLNNEEIASGVSKQAFIDSLFA